MTDEAPKPKKKRGKKKGSAKTGGRKKGTPNRNSLSVLSSLDKANIPIVEFLVTDIQQLEPFQRIDVWFRLLAFCYPKLKEIEMHPHLPGPAGAAGALPAPAAGPPPARSPEERLRVIRGQVPGKPEASG